MAEKREFVMGTSDKYVSSTVTGVLEAKTFLVAYKDHEGKDKTSLVFQPKGSKRCFMLRERIGGATVATGASKWFENSFNRFVEASGIGLTPAEIDNLGEEGVAQL